MEHKRLGSEVMYLVGPTASGKTQLALLLANRLNAEIISLDSMAVYRHMAIGTAQPSPEERARVPHHLVAVLDPSETPSVAWYLEQAREIVHKLASRGKRALLVGGTPMYLKACLRGLFDGPPANDELRAQHAQLRDAEGVQAVHRQLAQIDPVSAQRLHPNDFRRVSRALEVFHLTQRTMTDWHQQFDRPADPPPAVAWLHWPREQLIDRINRRVHLMLDQGWMDETRVLLDRTPPMSQAAAQAAGYLEIAQHFAGELTHDQMVDRIQARTRQLAKRQTTWFRHLAECEPIDADQSLENLLEEVTQRFDKV